MKYSTNQYDKFQIASILSSEAIVSFFHGAHHLAVLNNVHAASQIIHDVFNNYHTAFPRERTGLITHRQPDGQRDPLIADIHPKANFLKHAKKDWMKTKDISDLDAFTYLNTLCYDYRVLRDHLLGDNLIKPHAESQKTIEDFESTLHGDLLFEIFSQYMWASLFHHNENGTRLPIQDKCPNAFGFQAHNAKKQIAEFLEDNGLGFGASHGMADYYMTNAARPILENSSIDRSNPRPRAG